jgi:outer membrane murein-binding lipoprotein Lpp
MMRRKFVIGALFIVLLLAGCSQEIDKKKFESVNRAARSVKQSLAAGANYERFGDLLQELSAQITALNGKVQRGKEQQLLKEYSELLTIYRDGLILWKYRIEASRYDFIPRGLIYVGQDVEPIVEKYRIPTESHMYGPTHQSWKSIPGDSIQSIWMNANSQLEKIDALLEG